MKKDDKTERTRGREVDLETPLSSKSEEFWDEMTGHYKPVARISLMRNEDGYRKIEEHNKARRKALSYWDRKEKAKHDMIMALAFVIPIWLAVVIICLIWISLR